ncbi:uncharacterized protein LOC144990220 [Oryzias latipes]
MNFANTKKPTPTVDWPVRHLVHHSAVNRQQHQKRIERENQAGAASKAGLRAVCSGLLASRTPLELSVPYLGLATVAATVPKGRGSETLQAIFRFQVSQLQSHSQ